MKKTTLAIFLFLITQIANADDALYGANFLGGGVSNFGTVNSTTGDFTQISILPNGLGWPLGDMVSQSDPVNGIIFSSQGSILAITKSSGATQTISPTNFSSILGFDTKNNQIIYDSLVGGVASLYSYSMTSGESTLIQSTVATASGWQAGGIGMVNSYAREAYLYDSSANKIYVTNVDTGLVKTPISLSQSFIQMSIDENNQKIFGLVSTGSGLVLGMIDLKTGVQSIVGGIIGSASANYVGTISSLNNIYYYQGGSSSSDITAVSTITGNVIGTFTAPGRLFPLAQVVLGGTSDSVFSSQIQDSTASLVKLGTNTVTLTGNNSYTGPTEVISGTLSITGTNNTSAITVESGAKLVINSPSNLGTGDITLNGTATIPATISITQSSTISNPIIVVGDPTFNIASGTTTTISSAISDGASAGDVMVTGGGALTLTAANTYTGPTTIFNDGSTLSLSGNGSIAASSAVVNNGTFNIRGKVGNVSVLSYTQSSTGTLAMNFSAASNQKISITGTASVGGSLSLSASPGSYVAGRYALLTAINGVSGTFSSLLASSLNSYTSYHYSLSYDANDVYLNLFSGPALADTQTSLTNNLASLQGAFNLQTSIINNGLNYDCSLFDVHGLCISTGGRITNTNTPTGDSTGALVIGGYRVNDNVRVGAYLDQGISSSTPTGINLKQHNPLFGGFAVWQARQDGLGAQVKVAAGYNDSDMTVTRAVVGTSEAGSGSTSLISQAVSLVGSYGVEMQGSWIASPYVGIRYTDVKAGGYTEASSATVTAPLSYASLSQSTTSLLAGIRWSGKLTDRVGLNGSVGVEQDVSNNNLNYTATGAAGLTPIVFNTDINKTRPVASIGTTVSIDKRQQLAFCVFYSEQAFIKSSTTSAYGTYTIGF